MLSRSWIKVLWQITIHISVMLNHFPKVKNFKNCCQYLTALNFELKFLSFSFLCSIEQ